MTQFREVAQVLWIARETWALEELFSKMAQNKQSLSVSSEPPEDQTGHIYECLGKEDHYGIYWNQHQGNIEDAT